jgi:hypothetical protein
VGRRAAHLVVLDRKKGERSEIPGMLRKTRIAWRFQIAYNSRSHCFSCFQWLAKQVVLERGGFACGKSQMPCALCGRSSRHI